MCACSLRRVPASIRGSAGELDPQLEANLGKTVGERGFGETVPCSGHHALTVVLRSTSDISIDHRLLSSSAADAARPDWTEPAHKVPPGTTAQNRFLHVRTVRILLRTRGAPQLQPRPTDSKFPDPAGATEPSRTDSENKEEHSPVARGGESPCLRSPAPS